LDLSGLLLREERGRDDRGGEGGRRREGRGGLSVNVAEEAFALKSAPDCMDQEAVPTHDS